MKEEVTDLIIVEDNFQYEEILIRNLEEAFPNARHRTYYTETDFRDNLERILKTPPSAIIMDIMLPWESPKPTPHPRPPDVERDGLTTAGFRCQKLLSERSGGAWIPIILYSAFPDIGISERLSKLPDNVRYLSKNDIALLPGLIKMLVSSSKQVKS